MSKLFHDAFERDNHRCVYCGKYLLADFEVFMSAKEDHLRPLSKGGKNELSNIVISCNVCNRLKSNYFPDESSVADDNKLVSVIRDHIMKKRAQNLKIFMSWITHEQKHYYI
jgi:predicted restriction endonuclease